MDVVKCLLVEGRPDYFPGDTAVPALKVDSEVTLTLSVRSYFFFLVCEHSGQTILPVLVWDSITEAV